MIPLRFFASLDVTVPVSSVKLVRPRFCRKNFSGRNEKPGNLSAISNVRFDAVVETMVVDVDDGPDDVVAALVVVAGMPAVASGSTLMVDDVSFGTTTAGFLTKDKNKCRHRSSGTSELSTSNSRNCRKP